MPLAVQAIAVTTATVASVVAMNAAASRVPSRSLHRWIRRSAIVIEPQPVAAADDGLHDPRLVRIELDLAAQVLHMAVDRALVPVELVPPNPVDELVPG